MNKEPLAHDVILKCIVGSKLFGLNTTDSDTDEMGICIENIESVVGFNPFEQYEDSKTDLVIYGLRKYVKLALNGNPTILSLLFAPPEFCTILTSLGSQLRDLRNKIISKHAGNAFLGYAKQQRERLFGVRGQKNVNRIELVKKYGYDTKYAMHMLRLPIMGITLMDTGDMILPMYSQDIKLLKDVRDGCYSLSDCMKLSEDLEAKLKEAMNNSNLPTEPDYEAVEKWMCRVYLNWWKANDASWSNIV